MRFIYAMLLSILIGGISKAQSPSTQPAGSLDARFKIGQVIFSDDFNHGVANWVPELQNGGKIIVQDGKLEIDVPAGCTLWFKREIQGSVLIEYDATVISKGGPNDRVSDLNCFWMAQDPRSPGGVLDTPRSGKLEDYNQLKCYYVGQGGNYNSTTRFRRYIGSPTTRPILPEHDLQDRQFLLTANIKQKVQLIACGNLIQYYHNGKKLFELNDPEPYTSGWFALRTVINHMVIENFRVKKLTPRSN